MGQGVAVVRNRLGEVLAWRDTRMLCLIFLISQVLDVISTHTALATQRFEEGNPWLAEMTNQHPVYVYGAKLLCAAAVLTGLLLLRLRWRLRLAVLSVFTMASLVAPLANAMRIQGWL
jgi:Domain of unknown function (DUF5658)